MVMPWFGFGVNLLSAVYTYIYYWLLSLQLALFAPNITPHILHCVKIILNKVRNLANIRHILGIILNPTTSVLRSHTMMQYTVVG